MHPAVLVKHDLQFHFHALIFPPRPMHPQPNPPIGLWRKEYESKRGKKEFVNKGGKDQI
jgi:hypothetical protein